MDVKQLMNTIQLLLQEGAITPETKVIIDGVYGYGTNSCGINVRNMAHIDGEEVVNEPIKTLCIGIDSYLYEHEDVGYSDMYIDADDLFYKMFKEKLSNEM